MSLDVCKELVSAMTRLGFREDSVNQVKRSTQYINACAEAPEMQKTILTMLFYNLLMYKPNPIPTNIRIALNAANTASAWLDDMATAVLPFMQANEDTFFATVH